ncbi:PAS domain-containing hybrid sensor histidine kinase/response regulator [Asticcacaulis sp. YBE204]|uniref:PAS domain-containing hybrid sensor histidine kinase/response regulator n=1 Tax=Asticcacaulis sp. YBE204 TaxID=1282363 RepID=UPI0003C3DC02|nr:PAS domain-containing hybrid sensor histidine kinase/response regulator [Asticcacaulis sp. YBE204]ESQ77888.1 hypothetical protein AEYBE204_16550 [Asticcacaulis sp. YBE204]
MAERIRNYLPDTGALTRLPDGVPVMIRVSDAVGRSTGFSNEWLAFRGQTLDQALSEDWITAIHPDDQETFRDLYATGSVGREPREQEYRLKDAKGDYRWMLDRSAPRYEGFGHLIGFTHICTDIDVYKHREQYLTEARDAAERLSQARSEFLAHMSHEIRTPMSAVIGLAHILATATPPLPEKQANYARILQSSADSLLDLINDCLDIAKIEAGHVELEALSFDLTRLVRDVLDMLRLKAEEKGVRLDHIDLSKGAGPHTFTGDPARLRQMLVNLCANAVKFTDKGRIEVTTDYRPDPQPDPQSLSGELIIRVKDTGIGIDATRLDTIFDKFVQADSATHRTYGGTGLGLAITRALAEKMGGRVTVNSSKGQGAVFTLRLPLRPSDASPSDQTLAPRKAGGRRVLVVDSGPDAVTCLQNFGYICDVTPSGEAALERFALRQDYAAILIDVQLDGHQTAQALRAAEARRGRSRIPMLGLVAGTLPGDRVLCLKAGMDDALPKPLDPVMLRQKMERLLVSDAA